MLNNNYINDFKRELSKFSVPEFIFDEVEHKYTHGNRELISATTYIKNFYKGFDAKAQAKKYAEKHGLVESEVLKSWEDAGEYARNLGTAVHKWLEDYWNGLNPPIPVDEEVANRINFFLNFKKKYLDMLVPVVQEQRIFNLQFGISGTIDAIFYVENPLALIRQLAYTNPELDVNEDTGETGEFQIWDYKTNKDGKFTTDSDYSYGRLKKPFGDLYDNEHNKYSLQVSLYRIMLEDLGIVTGHAYLCHIPPSGNIRVYRAKDLRQRLRRHLNNKFHMTDAIESLF